VGSPPIGAGATRLDAGFDGVRDSVEFTSPSLSGPLRAVEQAD
jgi:hypothetical protein